MPEPDHASERSPARVVAYQHPELDGVLFCREHGENWAGLIPLTTADLTGVGFCSWGTDDDATVCGRALPAKKPRQ
ncbi:hypothetical protein ACIP4W_36370 [Streptomyces sp. NPDC088846]|uniref:hypothetical protein n=1 Tax=Streptomyces sp. NPDC088846 TaxID=3365908 RepID=UPI0038076DE5